MLILKVILSFHYFINYVPITDIMLKIFFFFFFFQVDLIILFLKQSHALMSLRFYLRKL